jgi:peptide/nickel transport system permease protein
MRYSSLLLLPERNSMGKYTLRRLLQAVPTFFGITLISFLMILSAPGDPITLITFRPNMDPDAIATLRRQLGLDRPIWLQYVYWLVGNDWSQIDLDGDGIGDIHGTRRGLLRGDLGSSLQMKQPVLNLILQRVPATLQLTLSALIVGYVMGVPLGVFSAVHHRGWFDQVGRIISVIGNAVPSFWLGLILIIVFSVNLKWLPIGGMTDVTRSNSQFDLWDAASHMIMPVLVLSLGTIAVVSRFMRNQTLEVLSQDYVRTARAKGLSNQAVLWKHVVGNALFPVATLLGPQLGTLLGGAVIIEQVFSWPGMGKLVITAVFQRDYPLIMGSVVIGAVLFILGVLLSDILYTVLDPRVKLG